MNKTLTGLCAEFSRQARFRLALIPLVPNRNILRAMEKEGWRVEYRNPTPAELAANVSSVGHGGMIMPTCIVKNPQGQDVLATPNPTLYDEYRETIRRTAAHIYGISLK